MAEILLESSFYQRLQFNLIVSYIFFLLEKTSEWKLRFALIESTADLFKFNSKLEVPPL